MTPATVTRRDLNLRVHLLCPVCRHLIDELLEEAPARGSEVREHLVPCADCLRSTPVTRTGLTLPTGSDARRALLR